MKLRSSFALVSLVAAVTASCGDDSSNAPTAPMSSSRVRVLTPYEDLRAQTFALFPWTNGLVEQPLRNIRDMRDALAAQPPKTAKAHELMFSTLDYTMDAWRAGLLFDPNGANPPTTAEAVCKYFGDLFVFVGLPRPGACPSITSGGAEVLGAAGGLAVTGDGQAGSSVPSGALPQTVLLVITPLPDPTEPRTGPLNTELDQYPQFYDISVFPASALSADMLVGVCVYDPPNPLAPTFAVAQRLRLAHNVGEGIEILPLAPAPFLTCAPTPERSGAILDRFLKFAAGVFAPKPLFAAAVSPGGVGGLAKGFSPFGAVDPESDGEDPPPPPPPDPDPAAR